MAIGTPTGRSVRLRNQKSFFIAGRSDSCNVMDGYSIVWHGMRRQNAAVLAGFAAAVSTLHTYAVSASEESHNRREFGFTTSRPSL